jgi:hypothetical protein
LRRTEKLAGLGRIGRDAAAHAKGFTVGRTTVARLLKHAGYRLQATFKTKEGAQHPDRGA